MAKGSVSHKCTHAPKLAKAKPKIPLPQPTSKANLPLKVFAGMLEKLSKSMRVLSWCPVPKARLGSIVKTFRGVSVGGIQLGVT